MARVVFVRMKGLTSPPVPSRMSTEAGRRRTLFTCCGTPSSLTSTSTTSSRGSKRPCSS